MTGSEARRFFKDYMKLHNINWYKDFDNGCARFTMEYMSKNSPGGFVESCIWFNEETAEVRVYYNAYCSEISRKNDCLDKLYRILNFINARVFLTAVIFADCISRICFILREYISQRINAMTLRLHQLSIMIFGKWHQLKLAII